MTTWVWLALLLVCTSTGFFLAALLAAAKEGDREIERDEARRIEMLPPAERLQAYKDRALGNSRDG